MSTLGAVVATVLANDCMSAAFTTLLAGHYGQRRGSECALQLGQQAVRFASGVGGASGTRHPQRARMAAKITALHLRQCLPSTRSSTRYSA